jgi:predicted nucleotidyltransferase
MDQERILDDVRRWASTDENVRLVVLTGSVAREGHAADELSDLDIELYVLDTAPLLNHGDWYQRFGQVLVVEELENPDWHPTRLIYYVDGKIDFMIAQVETAKGGIGYTRAYRVVVDNDGLADHLHLTSESQGASSDGGRVRDVHQLVLRSCAHVCEVHRPKRTMDGEGSRLGPEDRATADGRMGPQVAVWLGSRHMGQRRSHARVDGLGDRRRARCMLGWFLGTRDGRSVVRVG